MQSVNFTLVFFHTRINSMHTLFSELTINNTCKSSVDMLRNYLLIKNIHSTLFPHFCRLNNTIQLQNIYYMIYLLIVGDNFSLP